MATHLYHPLPDRRHDHRKKVNPKSDVRFVLSTKGRDYLSDAELENVSEHGALVHLLDVSSEVTTALGESPIGCAILVGSSSSAGPMLLQGDVKWILVLRDEGRHGAYAGVQLSERDGQQKNPLFDFPIGAGQVG